MAIIAPPVPLPAASSGLAPATDVKLFNRWSFEEVEVGFTYLLFLLHDPYLVRHDFDIQDLFDVHYFNSV